MFGEGDGVGWGGDFVGDDFDFGAGGGELEHVSDEVEAAFGAAFGFSVDGGGAYDDVVLAGGGDEMFSGEFAGGVYAEGCGEVCFDIGLGAGVPEDVVGADVHKACVCLFAGFGEVVGAGCVDGVGGVWGAFAFDDVVCGGGVDYEAGLYFVDDETVDGVGIGDIDTVIFAVDICFMYAAVVEDFANVRSQLPFCADDEYLHEVHPVLT